MSPARPGGPGERRAAPTAHWQMTSSERDMMSRFRQDYLLLLDGRVAAIEQLVGGTRVEPAQVEPAQVALLSLESSSAMLGLDDLTAAVRALRRLLERGEDDELAALLRTVRARAVDAHRLLDA